MSRSSSAAPIATATASTRRARRRRTRASPGTRSFAASASSATSSDVRRSLRLHPNPDDLGRFRDAGQIAGQETAEREAVHQLARSSSSTRSSCT